jgi:NitT/TauT family transport system permease protein
MHHSEGKQAVMDGYAGAIRNGDVAHEPAGALKSGSVETASTGRQVARWGWRAALSALPWVGLLLLWMAIRSLGIVNATLLPSPAEVFAEGWRQAASGELWRHLFASTARVVGGVLIGTSLALPVGFLLGRLPTARLIFEPMLNFFRALPPIALIPLVIVYFGIGEKAKLIVLSLAAFFPAVIVLYDGIAQLQPIYVQVARTLGATEREVFTRVILPLTIPHLLTALRLALGVTWATLVAAELVAAQRGLGAMIQIAASFFQLPAIFLGIICIGVTALLMDRGLRLLSTRLLHWQERLHP